MYWVRSIINATISTLEAECYTKITLPDDLLTHQTNGLIGRSVFHKVRWNWQWAHLYMFFSLDRELTFIRSPTTWAYAPSSSRLRKLSKQFFNVFPEMCTKKRLVTKRSEPMLWTAERNNIFIRHPLIEFWSLILFKKHFYRCSTQQKHAAQIILLTSENLLIKERLEDWLARLTRLICIYQIIFSWESQYIAREIARSGCNMTPTRRSPAPFEASWLILDLKFLMVQYFALLAMFIMV